ncbi:MAG: hypothetical protein HQL41_16085 [Alphaproteobacteria bacterium]|nr:hypothetical protein [Alphaproteobacteria bacterium]
MRELLESLDETLEWLVMFRLEPLRPICDLATLVTIFHLPPDSDLSGATWVVLTAAGRGVIVEGRTRWLDSVPPPARDPARSLWSRHAEALALVDPAPDLLGVGHAEGWPPTLLAATIEDGVAEARAIFAAPPPCRHYELLAAVGVTYLGAEPVGPLWRARFRNRLTAHLLAGLLGGLSRTGNCNRFFLDHGHVDGVQLAGLRAAAETRVARARHLAMNQLGQMALAARRQSLAMTCLPPPPAAPHPYGDLVPLGFVARALRRIADVETGLVAAAELLRRHLDAARQDGLWAFHRGRLVTATDSALVLLGLSDPAAVERLERFSDGAGGYLPQLDMVVSPRTRHWRRADLGTTLAVRALRREAGLAELGQLDDWFERRGALFFANPFLVDWLFALASPDRRLEAELRAAVNPQGGFGRWDEAFSTACAILALSALGCRDRLLRRAQLRLLELCDGQGHWPAATPFYSSELLEAEHGLAGRDGIIRAGGQLVAVTLYEDGWRMIGTAVAAMALSAPCDDGVEAPEVAGPAHPRYRAPDIGAYLAGFALPPYLDGDRS